MNYGLDGPGPASVNIRDGYDPLTSFSPKKITSKKTGMNLEERYIGQPNPNFKNPHNTEYQI